MKYMTYYIAFHTKFDHKMHSYEVKFLICVLYVTFKCHPTSARPRNSAELYGNLFCGIRRNSLKELERYVRTFPHNFRTFPQNGKIV